MAGIFKAYDIRGVYGESLTEDVAFRIGRAFATFTRCRTVTVGRDMRPHSEPLFWALARGLTLQGAEVIDLGLVSTPMCYFANGLLGADAGIMITASHNPGEWNGMKLTRAAAVPISGSTGIAEIERLVMSDSFDPPSATPGKITTCDVTEPYRRHVRGLARLRRPIRIAADLANAMGIVEIRALEGLLEVDTLYDNLDGTFPNHEANPLVLETLEALREQMRRGKYDFGVAFDGDADRVGFVDEHGEPIPMDMITALIARDFLAREKGVILYDLRSSRAVRETILESGGTPVMCRVGHAFIKQQMREQKAIFAGELSGHYYFRDNYYTESSAMAVLCVANIISASGEPISSLIRPLRRYAKSGEINIEVEDASVVLERLKTAYSDGSILTLDGVRVEYDDWWFSVRASNTEPLVRLNMEANNAELGRRKLAELLELIGGRPKTGKGQGANGPGGT
ncbi:MAG: phosphomannomutase/phosphoglucomutase [Kiritimatiellae bacterium]|nr:phosphomannomutase/phosphoglucomutase [Kiritimatiellia bacterium]